MESDSLAAPGRGGSDQSAVHSGGMAPLESTNASLTPRPWWSVSNEKKKMVRLPQSRPVVSPTSTWTTFSYNILYNPNLLISCSFCFTPHFPQPLVYKVQQSNLFFYIPHQPSYSIRFYLVNSFSTVFAGVDSLMNYSFVSCFIYI